MTQRKLARSAEKPPKAQSKTDHNGRLALGQLDRHLGYFLRRLQIWVFRDFILTLAAMKLRPAQYSVLAVIDANPGRSQAAVGQLLGIERARLARMLHELERRRWIARRANGSDARSHSLYMTKDGKKALIKIERLADKHETHLAALLGSSRHKQLFDWLRGFG